MSVSMGGPPPGSPPPPAPPARARRSAWFFVWTIGGGLLLLLIVAVAGLVFYASTPRFANIVRTKVAAAIQNSTGGRVELQSFHWNLRHLAIEADNLTIHGLEGPNEIPYAHIDRLYARARLLSFVEPKIALNYLEIDHPVFHLIVYPDGSTNQPRPPHKKKSERSLMDTIFDLQVGRVEVNDGVALINQRAIPFNLSANRLHAVVSYAPATDHYLGHLQLADLALQRGSAPPFHSQLALEAELARNAAEIKTLQLSSGASRLDMSGSVTNFASPLWKLSARGGLELREIAALAGIEGPREGTAELNLEGQGSGIGGFSIGGNLRLRSAGYQTSDLTIHGANATTRLRITPDEITLDGLNARLREGGTVDATIRFLHWNERATSASVAPARQPAPPSREAGPGAAAATPVGSIRARVSGVRLPAILRIVAIRRFQNLGFDTAVGGAVNADWTGSGADLTVAAKVQLRAPPSPAPGELPLSGRVDAKYFNRGGKVRIDRFEAHTPATGAEATGTISVYPLSGASALNVHLSTGNLAEFDRTLTDLGLTARGKTGVAAIPAQLHGEAEFTGAVTGSLIDPDVKGHLVATNFSTEFSGVDAARAYENASTSLPAAGAPESVPAPAFPVRAIHWDRLEATGEYSSSLIAIQQATLVSGGAAIDAHGQLRSHRISQHHSAFDDLSTIEAAASIHQASLTDLLAVAGESLPVSGTVNLQVHAGGSLGDLNGGGSLVVRGGELAGEPYRSITASLNFAGSHIDLVKLTLLQNGGVAIANGDYDLKSKIFLANLDATNFELAHFHRLQSAGIPVSGLLKFDAHASGAIQSLSVLIGVHLTNLSVAGESLGGVEGFAHTQGGAADFTAHSMLADAKLELSGQTALHGDFETHAKLVVAGLDVNPLLKLFKAPDFGMHSAIGGTLNVSGPAREPRQFSGDAEISPFSITLQNMTLESHEPLRASFRDGVIRLAQAHITGPDTDMGITGSAGVWGAKPLNLHANGSVNLQLAQSFDPNITSSGHAEFDVEAGGTLVRPALTGQVRLTNVAMALNDVPNGISQLNGTLVFDQNRLEVQNLVGTTGGGQLKLAGFITYQHGIYGDFTATGKDNRVRYSGLSATADTTLHLQGSETNMLLSGSVQITRFIIGPNFDFAVFATGPVAAPPPNLNAPSNHVRLDIHITSSPQLDFQNSYAQLAGSVDLRIRGTVAQPSILGRISITEGTANFAGTAYELQHGDIYFNNPVRVEPIIDIDATTRIQEYDVTVGLHGSASHLAPTFRSEPPLPQADVISLLALGRTQQEQQIYSQEEQQAGVNSTTNALLGGALEATVSNRVQKLFGVGSVKIDPTYLGNLGNSTARITVQQNISRNVQLTYATNVNTTAEQLIQAQVNLTQNVSVLAVRDESGVFSMVLKVHQRVR